jgi:hypothetical protein
MLIKSSVFPKSDISSSESCLVGLYCHKHVEILMYEKLVSFCHVTVKWHIKLSKYGPVIFYCVLIVMSNLYYYNLKDVHLCEVTSGTCCNPSSFSRVLRCSL